MSKKFAKLISEKECLCLIKGKITKRELIDVFLKANIQSLYDALADDIILAKLIKPHHYRFEIRVHAQEVENK